MFKEMVVNKYHKLPYDIMISRPSKWGNPFSHLDSTLAEFKVETRDEAVDAYTDWIFQQRELLADIKELRGKKLCCFCHPHRCHGHVLAQIANTSWWKDGKLILECSTKGDIRFSAFGAKIEVLGKVATIEEHYQLSKRFIRPNSRLIFEPKSIYDVKGKYSKVGNMELGFIEINGLFLDPSWREEFYRWMWIKYLDENPDLVTWAKRFDDYNDIFKGKSIICQADCIREYVNIGREEMHDKVKDFVYYTDIEV